MLTKNNFIEENKITNGSTLNTYKKRGRKTRIGIDDMWTTAPKQAELLLYPEDGYKYTRCSGKKVWWKCPCCGNQLYKTISYVHTRGLICGKCSDGISFPNKFMYNILSQLDINFETEYIIDGKNYRYDFYIPKLNLIIEMQGKQHYYGWNSVNITKEEIQLNDKNKEIYANQTGIERYIKIDARKTTKDYLKSEILDSELSNLFDLTKIDWDKCLFNSSKSLVKICTKYYNLGMTVNEISEKIKFSKTSVVNWLKVGNELKLCNWIPLKGFLEDEKPVIKLNDYKIYNSISEASRITKLRVQDISKACHGERKYCGIENGKPIVWMFLEDYKNENIKTKSLDVCISHNCGIKVNQYTLDGIYLNTYNSIKEAKMITGISTITNACLKKVYSAGNFRWYYIDDKMQPNKNKIQGTPRYYGEDRVYTQKGLKTKQLLDNPKKQIMIDCYDKYGNFIKTYFGYKSIKNDLGLNRDTVYKCCNGKSLPIGEYIFRYFGEPFDKYFYPDEFKNYINVYKIDNREYIGTYFSATDALNKLNLKDVSTVCKVLKKKQNSAYGYYFYYASDPLQPDKTKIVA